MYKILNLFPYERPSVDGLQVSQIVLVSNSIFVEFKERSCLCCVDFVPRRTHFEL